MACIIDAIHEGDHACIRSLLQSPHVDVNARDNFDATGLIVAATLGDVQAVRMLIGHPEVDATIADFGGTTALITAAEEGHEEVVRLLLESGKNPHVNASDSNGCTALLVALKHPPGHTRILEMLLDAPGSWGGCETNWGGRPSSAPSLWSGARTC